MTVYGVSMVRDESDVIAYWAQHMVANCDGVIVADNNSTDGTREILEEIAATHDQFLVVDEPRVGYLQSETIDRLAETARELGATWVVPADADEWWWSGIGSIAAALVTLPDEVEVVTVRPWTMVPSAADDASERNPFLRVHGAHREQGYQKVAFRPRPSRRIAMGNHHVQDETLRSIDGPLAMRHLPYRSFEQLRRKVRQGKAALEAAPELPSAVGWHWRELGDMDDETLARWWERWCDPAGLISLEF